MQYNLQYDKVRENSQSLATEIMSPRQQKEATTSSFSGPTWTTLFGLSSKGMQLTVTMYICNQGPFSSTSAHCISCAPSACNRCRRCCCCPLQCDGRRMGTLQEVQDRTTDHDLRLFCIYSHIVSPFSSIASFKVKSLLTHSSSDSTMITRSSA